MNYGFFKTFKKFMDSFASGAITLITSLIYTANVIFNTELETPIQILSRFLFYSCALLCFFILCVVIERRLWSYKLSFSFQMFVEYLFSKKMRQKYGSMYRMFRINYIWKKSDQSKGYAEFIQNRLLLVKEE